jgi:protein-S-isoprenylcysteine O-methyltransferase Ste14
MERFMRETGAARVTGFQRTKVYDLLAALPLIAWYLFGLGRQMPSTMLLFGMLMDGKMTLLSFLQLIALIGSMFLIFVLVWLLIRRNAPDFKARGFLPRATALAGTFLGSAFLYLKAVPLSLPQQAVADLLIIAGAVGSLIAVSGLGGAFSVMPEARSLVTSGPYAIVRHPLYVAEMIGVAGLVLQFQQPWAGMLGIAIGALQYWRTVFEERILTEAYPEYVSYRLRTRRFIPYLF